MPLQNHPAFVASGGASGQVETNDKEKTWFAAASTTSCCQKDGFGDRIGAVDWWNCATNDFSEGVPEEIPGCSHVVTVPYASCAPFKEKDGMPRRENSSPLAGNPSSITVSPVEREAVPLEARSLGSRQGCGATFEGTASLDDSICTDGKSCRGLEMTTCTTATDESACFGVPPSSRDDGRWCNVGSAPPGRDNGQTSARVGSLKGGSGDVCQERPRTPLCLQGSDLQNTPVSSLGEDASGRMSTVGTNVPGAVLQEGSSFIMTSENDDINHSQSETPAYVHEGTGEAAPAKAQSLFVPCMAVFSSNYNFTVTSIALFLMNQDPKYKAASDHVVGNSTVKMLSYAGAIFGMCTMGYLGDLIGRRRAMVFTLSLVCIGALLSSLGSWGDGVAVLLIMGICRFVLGVGSGGVYPLSAVSAAEGAASEQADERSMRVSWAYSMNVPGIMFPYILALLLWWGTHNVDICFRVLLAFGALPALIIWLPAWRMKDTRECSSKDFAKHLASVFVTRHYWRQLLGTGICWLLYDVTAYGILLVQPEITQVIWGNKSSVFDVIWQNIVLNAVGIPGCYMGILVLKRMGVKWLQFWGFLGLAGSAFLLAATSTALKDVAWAQIVLLCLVNYFINWGASITTFILPSLVFPPEVRSTYSGVSAALGKIGAVAGIYTMKAILSSGGLVPMMVCAGIPSLLAALLTWWYVDPVPNTLKSSFLQCFGSLAGVCPFFECRKRAARRFSS